MNKGKKNPKDIRQTANGTTRHGNSASTALVAAERCRQPTPWPWAAPAQVNDGPTEAFAALGLLIFSPNLYGCGFTLLQKRNQPLTPSTPCLRSCRGTAGTAQPLQVILFIPKQS